ncbi:venom allergen 5-like, partial [Drosophila persimilis]|uniref:venom allergen 5-like n=1 Tax=Drosophila persimilis TaxID=7234 RepID=UPI000F093581
MWWWLLLTFPLIIHSQNEEWCDPNLCDNGAHILCKDDGKFYNSCPRDQAELIPMTERVRSMLTHVHNDLRNKVAAGYKDMPKAARMLEMQWDLDLAKVAEAAVRLCRLEKLSCATTPIYMWTGQNEALEMSDCLKSSDLVIRKHLDDWIRQGDYARKNHLTDPFSGITVTYFLQMVRDRCDRFGCAVSRYTERNITHQLIKCIYRCTFAVSSPTNPVYEVALTNGGEKCASGRSTVYEQLCHKRES